MAQREWLDRLISLALEEDIGPGDWTTLWTVGTDARGTATIVAKEPLVAAGTGWSRPWPWSARPRMAGRSRGEGSFSESVVLCGGF